MTRRNPTSVPGTTNYNILLYRMSAVDAALQSIVKRAKRRKIEGALSWTWGKAYEEVRGQGDKKVIIPRVPLTIHGTTPRIKGWRFIATLQHIDGEAIIRTLPGEVIDRSYQKTRSICQHCNVNRRRCDTYVLQNDDGRTIQVGSSCITDFLGGDYAADIAAMAELLALADSAASEDGDESFGGGGNGGSILLSSYLPMVAFLVRTDGWKSRTASRDEGGPATADKAWDFIHDFALARKHQAVPTPEDKSTAEAAETWAESISDAEIETATGDYLHNLRLVARTGLASRRTIGIAASTITAYQRFIGAQRSRAERAARPNLNEYLGNVGDKVSFGLPPKLDKKGNPAKGAPVVIGLDPLTLDFVTGYETEWGYVTVLKFRTIEGATLVWKASSTEVGRDDVGKKYTLVGTIKKHEEYKDSKQTILTRCNVTEVPT